MSYNWHNEYRDLWWLIRKYGVDPNDENIQNLLEEVFATGYELAVADLEEEYTWEDLERKYEDGYTNGTKDAKGDIANYLYEEPEVAVRLIETWVNSDD
jgi:hypothetical protein